MANLATDSAKELHEIVSDDATATFESDPTFVDSNPGTNGSSDNVERQRDTDDLEDGDEEIEDEDDLDDEEDLEDDEDELAASPGLQAASVDEEDDDADDVDQGVDEDDLDDDDMDTDQVAERALRMQAFYARRSQDVAARMCD